MKTCSTVLCSTVLFFLMTCMCLEIQSSSNKIRDLKPTNNSSKNQRHENFALTVIDHDFLKMFSSDSKIQLHLTNATETKEPENIKIKEWENREQKQTTRTTSKITANTPYSDLYSKLNKNTESSQTRPAVDNKRLRDILRATKENTSKAREKKRIFRDGRQNNPRDHENVPNAFKIIKYILSSLKTSIGMFLEIHKEIAYNCFMFVEWILSTVDSLQWEKFHIAILQFIVSFMGVTAMFKIINYLVFIYRMSHNAFEQNQQNEQHLKRE